MIRLDDLNDDDRITVMLAYGRVVRERLAAERGILIEDVPRLRFLELAIDGWGGYEATVMLEDGTGPLTLRRP